MPKRIATIPLAQLSQHGDVVGFEYEDAFRHATDGLILRHRDQLIAYRNECPHWNIAMDIDEVYDAVDDVLRCPYHGACFTPQEGLCTEGPVQGAKLVPLKVEVDEETGQAHVYLTRGLDLSF